MEKTIQNIPFLRIVIALAFGIYLGSAFPVINTYFTLITIFIFTSTAFIINKIYKFSLQTIFGITITIIFIATGFYLYNEYNQKPIFYEDGIFDATILEQPQEKANSYQTVANINFIKKDNIEILTNEQVIIYFSKENIIENLQPGNVILFNRNPQQIKNFGNPYEFDYKKYLERKKIYRQVYLNNQNWEITSTKKNSIVITAGKTRQKLLNIYQKLPIDENELEILSALTLGYKRDLDPETKRVFSSAGAMHVLAVSGLHVGIIFWIIIFMFGYLRKQKSGRIIFAIISIVSLWGYAFLTGLSPSVMRATTMFTIFIFSETIQRRSNIYNSLAASAFILLIINPNNLFETGFQLSFSAVFGIVFLQPKLSSIITIKGKIPLFFWNLLCISIAAQISTVPFTLYYFGQFPSYFWLTNIIIIPAITVLIPLGILLLFISSVPIIANIIATIVNSIIKFIFYLLTYIEQLPYSVLNTSISTTQEILLIILIITFFIILKYKRIIYLQLALLCVFFFTFYSAYQSFTFRNKNELIVYNNSENATLELIHGKYNFIVTEKELQKDDQTTKAIELTSRKRKLFQPQYLTFNDSVINNHLYLQNGVIYFEGKVIIVENHERYNQINSPCIVLNPPRKLKNNIDIHNSEIIITNKSYLNNTNNNNPVNQYATLETAFRKIW